MSEDEIKRELRRLTADVEDLRGRMALLEEVFRPRQDPEALPPDSGARLTLRDKTFSAVFTRLAAVCFALLGALVLRVATQQGWVSALLGTSLGLFYCLLLLFASKLLSRISLFAQFGNLLTLCGIILAPLIVLETFHRNQAMSTQAATVSLLGVGLVGALVGAMRSQKIAVSLSLVLSLLALAALGLTVEASAWRAFAAVALALTSVVLSHWRGWAFLRPLVLAPAALLLTFALLTTAHRDGLPAEVPLLILAAVLALWALVASFCVLRAKALGVGDGVALPLASAWAFALSHFAYPTVATPVGLCFAVALFFAGGWLCLRYSPSVRLTACLLAAGALVATLGLPPLDPSGVSLALVAVLLTAFGLRIQNQTLLLLSLLLALTAAATSLLTGWLSQIPVEHLVQSLLGGAALGALLLLHARLTGGPALEGRGTVLWRRLASLSLLSGVVTLYVTLRAVCYHLLGPGDAFLFSETFTLAALAVLGVLLGKALGIRSLWAIGLAGVGLLVLRLIARDLFALRGGYLLASVVTVGLSFVATSLSFKRRDGP